MITIAWIVVFVMAEMWYCFLGYVSRNCLGGRMVFREFPVLNLDSVVRKP